MGYALKMESITKEFPGVLALNNVSFNIKKGEIHALVGENGAGKSTLMKILSGFYPAGTFEGKVYIEGKEQQFQTIKDAEAAGISIIYQELALATNLTVAENVFLGNEPKRFGIILKEKMYVETEKWLDQVGLKDTDPDTKISLLGVGKQQLVEIAKALSKNAKILILDEPTAALTEQEVDILLNLLRELKRNNVTCIYISHKLGEVFSIADTITVLRDGEAVATLPKDQLNEKKVISLMVGRDMEERFPNIDKQLGKVALEVINFSVWQSDKSKKLVDNISFNIRKGEIVGIAGLMGAGRTELAMGLFGAFGDNKEGDIKIDGMPANISNVKDAINQGLALVSEDRKKYGLILQMQISENINLPSLEYISRLGLIDQNNVIKNSQYYYDSLKIKAPSIDTQVSNLSGGNQQKVVIGKWLLTNPKILILDEPTRGIDVGAKFEIYNLINALAAEGVAILLISSELPEVIGMCDRILVLNNGSLTGNFDKNEATQEKIMEAATEGM